MEIILVSGRHPTRQRNLAAQRARGEILYFLDHDSIVSPRAVELLSQAIRRGAAAAGGPNVGAGPATLFSGAGEMVLGSPLGSLIVWPRYRPEGESPRPAGEESLILCNLMVRRSVFLELRGFDPRLYPNEENDFLNRLRRRWNAIYEPRALVFKPRAGNLLHFLRENFRYARGRMEQIWIAPSVNDLPYLAGLAAVMGTAAVSVALAGAPLPAILFLYVLAVTAEAARMVCSSEKAPRGRGNGLAMALIAAGLMGIRHVTYAFGMFWGMITGWRKRRIRLRPESFILTVLRQAGKRMVAERPESLQIGLVGRSR